MVPRAIIRRASSRYIAGATLDEAIATVRVLNDDGAMATLDVLGEYVTQLSQAETSVHEYNHALESIERNNLDANVSVKLSSLGLLIDSEYCFQRMRDLCQQAKERNNFIRIDMEDSEVTEVTLDIHRKLLEEFENVGVAIQSYMRRTQNDVSALIQQGANVRVCKGIYVEPRSVAWKDDGAVNRNFARAVRRLLERGCYVGIATHDESLVWETERIIEELNLDKSKYEFQMLLGVEEDLRRVILAAGHRLRVYVPFGSHWYEYSTRRLRENPKLAGYIIKGMLNGSK